MAASPSLLLGPGPRGQISVQLSLGLTGTGNQVDRHGNQADHHGNQADHHGNRYCRTKLVNFRQEGDFLNLLHTGMVSPDTNIWWTAGHRSSWTPGQQDSKDRVCYLMVVSTFLFSVREALKLRFKTVFSAAPELWN